MRVLGWVDTRGGLIYTQLRNRCLAMCALQYFLFGHSVCPSHIHLLHLQKCRIEKNRSWTVLAKLRNKVSFLIVTQTDPIMQPVSDKLIFDDMQTDEHINWLTDKGDRESTQRTEKCLEVDTTVFCMSCWLHRVREDMDITKEKKGKLLTDMEDLTISLLNLALTGHAVSFLHNGDILYDSRGNALVSSAKSRATFIILNRDNVLEVGGGVCYWHRKEGCCTVTWLIKVHFWFYLYYFTTFTYFFFSCTV